MMSRTMTGWYDRSPFSGLIMNSQLCRIYNGNAEGIEEPLPSIIVMELDDTLSGEDPQVVQDLLKHFAMRNFLSKSTTSHQN